MKLDRKYVYGHLQWHNPKRSLHCTVLALSTNDIHPIFSLNIWTVYIMYSFHFVMKATIKIKKKIKEADQFQVEYWP